MEGEAEMAGVMEAEAVEELRIGCRVERKGKGEEQQMDGRGG